MDITWQRLDHADGPTEVPGFTGGATRAEIRGPGNNRLDLGLLISARPLTTAGVFTRHALPAAPVVLSRQRLQAGHPIHGLIVNSGNANACTGQQGLADAEAMALLAAEAAGLPPASLLVCSTGRIGRHLPMDRIRKALPTLASDLGDTPAHGQRLTEAILTSDTRPKRITLHLETPHGRVHLHGFAKGAGMIQPDMATMLAFLATDAEVHPETWQEMLTAAVDASFNRITIDGDMSTNDTVLAFASGASGVPVASFRDAFTDALTEVCQELARQMVADGERTTKVVTVQISGAPERAAAEAVARAIANSLLVKSSWFGGDPNWGRVLDAAGYAGVPLTWEHLRLAYRTDDGAEALVVTGGQVHDDQLHRWREIVAANSFALHLDLGSGPGASTVLSTDLTPGYVTFNQSE